MNRFHLRCSYRVLLKMYIDIYTNPSSRTCMWSHALQPNCRQSNFSLPSDVGKKQGVGSIGLWQNTWMKCLWIWGHSQIIKRSRATIWSKAQNRSQKSLKWKVLNCKKMEPPLTWPDHRLTPSKRHQPRARAASRADRRWLGSAKSGLVGSQHPGLTRVGWVGDQNWPDDWSILSQNATRYERSHAILTEGEYPPLFSWSAANSDRNKMITRLNSARVDQHDISTD